MIFSLLYRMVQSILVCRKRGKGHTKKEKDNWEKEQRVIRLDLISRHNHLLWHPRKKWLLCRWLYIVNFIAWLTSFINYFISGWPRTLWNSTWSYTCNGQVNVDWFEWNYWRRISNTGGPSGALFSQTSWLCESPSVFF